MAKKLQSFAEAVSRDLKTEDKVELDPISIIALIQGLLTAFPCLNPMSSEETANWVQSHPHMARNLSIREIKKSEGVKRRYAAEIYDRSMNNAVGLGDQGLIDLIEEAKAGE